MIGFLSYVIQHCTGNCINLFAALNCRLTRKPTLLGLAAASTYLSPICNNFLFIFDVCSFSEQERSQQAHLYMTDPFLCRGLFLLMDLLNFLHPEISMYILYTVFYTFPKVLTRRFCSTIKSSCTC